MHSSNSERTIITTIDTLKIENPLPLQKICHKSAFKLFDELTVSKLDFGKNGELSLKPKIQEIFRYFKCLSKFLLRVLITEYVEKNDTKELVDIRTRRNHSISNSSNTLLFLLFGLPVPVKCNLNFLSTPVVNFVESYSKNLSCLTLISYSEIESVEQMRNLFFALKNLEELVIESCEETILHCLTAICNCEILPALKSLCICSNEFHLCTILKKSLQLLSFRKFNNFETKFRKYTSLHIASYEDVQKFKFNSNLYSSQLITEVLTLIKNNYANISSLDLIFDNPKVFQIFDSLPKLKSLKLSPFTFCFQECLVILKKYPQIEILHLRNCTDVNLVDLVNFNNQLKELVFTGCTFKLDMVSTDHFIRLKHLKIADSEISEVLLDGIIRVASSSPNIRKLEFCSISSDSDISRIDIFEHLSCFLMPIDKFIFNNLPFATLQNIEELSFCVCTCTATVLKTFLSFFKSLKILKIVCLIVSIDEMELVMEYFANSSVSVTVHCLLDKEKVNMLTYKFDNGYFGFDPLYHNIYTLFGHYKDSEDDNDYDDLSSDE